MAVDPNAPTDTNVGGPWSTKDASASEPVLHLVVGWFLAEQDRAGQVASLAGPRWLGRGETRPDDVGEAIDFVEQRPGETLSTPAIKSTSISRRQLLFSPAGRGGVDVRCVGRRALFHNGARVDECVAAVGDVLVLEDTAVFLLEERPTTLSSARHYGTPAFPFGKSDAQGVVGESPAAWRLRELLAEAAQSGTHVLIQGESGAGKELAARFVHERSKRARGPLVARSASLPCTPNRL